MKKNLCKWLSLFAAAVLLATTLVVSPFFATAADDEWTVKLSASEYSSISDASAFKQTDSAIPAYDGVLGYRFSVGSKTTGWVVYDAGTTVNTFKVGAILGNASSTAMLTFDVSADGNSWTPVDATATQVDAEGRPGWPTFDYTAKTTDAFRYLRVNFVDSAYNFDPLICNIYMKNDAAETEAERSYDITLLPTQATAESEGVLTAVEDAYYAFVKDGVRVGGTLVWELQDALRSFSMDALISNVNWGGTVTVHFSIDGKKWNKPTLTEEVVSAHPNGGWGASYVEQYCVPKKKTFRYVRVTFAPEGGIINFPAIRAVQVTTAGSDISIPCDKKVAANEYIEKSEHDFVASNLPAYDGSSGYRFSAGAVVTDAWAVYDAGETMTNFRATAIMGNVLGDADLSFDVSNDRETWTHVYTKSVGKVREGGWPTLDLHGSYAAGFRYLRVNFVGSRFGWDPSLCNVYFGKKPAEKPQKPESFGNVVSAGNMLLTSDTEDAVNKAEIEDITNGYYTIVKQSDMNTRVDGSMTLYSIGAIESYNFHTVDGWNAKTEFFASKDGENWEALQAEPIQGQKTSNSGWGEVYQFEHYGYLDKAAGYHYLRVKFTAGLALPFGAFGKIEYNAAASGPVFDPVTDNKVTPDQMYLESSDKDAVLNAESEDDFVKPYFTIRSADKNQLVNGSLTFMTNEAIEKYVFATIESDTWNGNWKFYASKDGQTWVLLEPKITKGEKAPNANWGPCYQRDNRGTLDKAENYRYLRAEITTEGAGVPFPSIAYAEFNTDEPEPLPQKPDNFNNKILPTNMTLASDTEGAKLKPESDDIAQGWTIRSADGSGLVNGSLTLKAKAAIESYNFATVESDTWNGNWKFYASKDGQTWVELTPVIAKGKKASSEDWGPCYMRDNYGTLDKADGYLYLRAEVTTGGAGVPFPSIDYVQYYAEGLPDGVPEEKPDIDDLELPSSETDFTTLMKKGIFKLHDVVLSTNNEQAKYFGAPNAAIVMTAGECSIDMYTPNVRDFKFVVAPTKTADKLQVRAYGRQTQYGEETEIALMHTANIRPDQVEGFYPWYQYRVADRANMAQDYLYIRIAIIGAQWTNIHSFTYFYDGPEPGDVPDDEQAEPEDTVGTEREGVKTINANKGNLGFLAQTNMGFVANGGNSDYIGAKAGIVIFPDPYTDASAVFATEGISKFWVKFLIGTKNQAENLKASFFVAPSADAAEDEWTEITAHLEPCTDKVQPTGWAAIEYVMDEDQQIPEGSNVLKVFIPAEENNVAGGAYLGTGCQIARVDYEWSIPEVDPLPDMVEPDETKGEKEMLEDFSGTQLEEKNGGKAFEATGLEWVLMNLGSENGQDKVYYREDNELDAYLIYKLKDIALIDVRGYRSAEAEEDLMISVSADGEEWIALEKFTRKEAKLYGGPVSFAHIIDTADIPGGMNFVKIEIPELAMSMQDLVISDIHVIYGSNVSDGSSDDGDATENDGNGNGRTDNPKTGVALPFAGMAVSLLAGVGVVISRKRREDRVTTDRY